MIISGHVQKLIFQRPGDAGFEGSRQQSMRIEGCGGTGICSAQGTVGSGGTFVLLEPDKRHFNEMRYFYYYLVLRRFCRRISVKREMESETPGRMARQAGFLGDSWR